MLKLSLLILIFVTYNVVFGIFLLPDWHLQSLALLLICLLSVLRLGLHKLLSQIKLLLPFVGMLILVYGIFIILGISPQGTTALSYWLAYGLPRILLLISSILLLRIFISFMRMQDFFDSGLSIHYLKYLILGRILYRAAFHSYPLLREWQSLIPSEQNEEATLKQRYRKALTTTLALALYVLGEATLKGEMMDNRIANCYEEKQ
jgi:hypothetical protein